MPFLRNEFSEIFNDILTMTLSTSIFHESLSTALKLSRKKNFGEPGLNTSMATGMIATNFVRSILWLTDRNFCNKDSDQKISKK